MPQLFADGARAKLTVAITSASTTLTLDDASKFPMADADTAAVSMSNDWFKAVIQDDTGFEIIYVRTRNETTPNNLANVLRGQDGTTARAAAINSVVGLRPVSSDMGSVLTDATADNTLPPTTWTPNSSLLQAVRNCLKWLTGKFDGNGRIPISNGGTGAATAADALLALDAASSSHSHSAATTGTPGFMSAAAVTKLSGIAANATANAADASLRDRSTHTGEQAISTVTGLATELANKFDKTGGDISGDINITGAGSFFASNSSDVSNASYIDISANATETTVASKKSGSGDYLPLYLSTSDIARIAIQPDGTTSFGGPSVFVGAVTYLGVTNFTADTYALTQNWGISDTRIATTAFVDRLRDIPRSGVVIKTAPYTLAISDRGTSIDTTSTVTFPEYDTVPFPPYSVVMITNYSNAAINILRSGGSSGVIIRLAGTALTGNRVLAPFGVATFRSVDEGVWIGSGAGLT